MRFLPCLTLAGLVFLGAVACSPQESSSAYFQAEAPLSVEPAFLDLGSVTFGERTSGIYRLKNTTGKPLLVSRIGPFSCQCVSAELELPGRMDGSGRRRLDGKRLNLTLAVDEEMAIHFTLDTSRYRIPASRKVGSIPVVFQDYSGMVLQWGADIWNPFSVEPWGIELGDIGVREGASGTAMVVAHDTIAFGLDIDFVDDEGWLVQSQEISVAGAGQTYLLTFTAPEVLPEGPFSKQFVLHTDLNGAPPVKVTLNGYARPDLSLTPSRLVFDPTSDRLEAQLAIRHRAVDGNLASLNLDALEAAGIEIMERIDIDAQHLVLRLRYVGEAAEQGQNLSIDIPTGDELTPLLKVAVSIMPKRGNS
ncbi:MAG: hypothetical protein COA70_06995 [Planctomycetota bacterium]|nr:MAG: hypothetical protein COA70_06995 [Planctomycetota bacterium]